MADPTTPNPHDPATGTTTGTTTTDTTAAGTTTQAGYHAEAVRVAPTGTTHDATTAHTGDKESTAAKKGLIVGVLTFLALTIWEWLSGGEDVAGSEVDSLTFWPEVVIYAIVGIIVGVIVKMIAKR